MLIVLTTLRAGRLFSRGSMTTGALAEDVRFSDLLAVFHPSESFGLQCSLKLVSEMAGKSQLSTCTVHIHWGHRTPSSSSPCAHVHSPPLVHVPCSQHDNL